MANILDEEREKRGIKSKGGQVLIKDMINDMKRGFDADIVQLIETGDQNYTIEEVVEIEDLSRGVEERLIEIELRELKDEIKAIKSENLERINNNQEFDSSKMMEIKQRLKNIKAEIEEKKARKEALRKDRMARTKEYFEKRNQRTQNKINSDEHRQKGVSQPLQSETSVESGQLGDW